MKISDLEQVIRDFISDFYKLKYIGRIEIEALEPLGYKVSLSRGVSYQPIIFYAELDDKSFLKAIKEDLKHKDFYSYGELNKIYPCYDERRVNRENR